MRDVMTRRAPGASRILQQVDVSGAEYTPDCTAGPTTGRSSGCAAAAPTRGPPTWRLNLTDGSEIAADIVILATGTAVDVTTDPLFRDLLRHCPPPVLPVAGLPVLDQDLRWAPGVNVFCMGALAALRCSLDPTP